MEYSYTFVNFFYILFCTAGLIVIIPLCILAPLSSYSSRVRWVALSTSIIGITALALYPVCPWPDLRKILIPFQILLLPSGGFLIFTLTHSYRNRKIEDYSSWIIDTLREKIVIFDKEMCTISRGNTGLPAGWFPYGSFPQLPETINDKDLSSFAGILNKPEKSSGTFMWNGTDLSYRLIPIEMGYLLVLLDISEETALVKELNRKNIQLENRRRSIQQMEGTRLEAEKEQYRSSLSSRINNSVRDNLITLLGDIEAVSGSGQPPETEKIRTMLKHAEESMASIRSMVRRLASE